MSLLRFVVLCLVNYSRSYLNELWLKVMPWLYEILYWEDDVARNALFIHGILLDLQGVALRVRVSLID